MTTHRLNHNDIQALDAIRATQQDKARANRRADCIAVIACAVAAVALAALLILFPITQ